MLCKSSSTYIPNNEPFFHWKKAIYSQLLVNYYITINQRVYINRIKPCIKVNVNIKLRLKKLFISSFS